jgi:FMN phosphatase YigB (HAD superfamily)
MKNFSKAVPHKRRQQGWKQSAKENTARCQEEIISEKIVDSSCQVVSFDIFDTLLLRPFLFPTDLFCLMDADFVRICGATNWLPFSEIRVAAEDECRRSKNIRTPENEDVTLDKIYDWIKQNYLAPAKQSDLLKRAEIDYEMRFAAARHTGKRLYDLAIKSGKRVVLISDMYLPRETIDAMLRKCGYRDHHKVYLSNEIGLCKGSGRLYKFAIKTEKIKAEHWLHIGDNVCTDVDSAKRMGMNALHLPKTTDLFKGECKDHYTGKSYGRIFFPGLGMADMLRGSHDAFPAIRCMLGVVANKCFDSPPSNFALGTDFNADPTYFGYYALGMYTYGVADWLIEKTRGKGISTVHFAARDGYLFKRVYDIIARYKSGAPKSNYLYCSRKSLFFADIKTKIDLYSLIRKINWQLQSPDTLFELLNPIIPAKGWTDYCDWVLEQGYKRTDIPFATPGEFIRYLKDFADRFADESLLTQANAAALSYLSDNIKPGDVLFDIGYSGRTESAVKSLLCFDVDSLYVHSNTAQVNNRSAVMGFKNETLFPYKPMVTGHLREHCTMEIAPSCIGYKHEKGKSLPVFEPMEQDMLHTENTRICQAAAVQFATDFTEIFGDILNRLPFRHYEACMPFEYFLHYAPREDLEIFDAVEFEDDFGTGTVNIVDITLNERQNINDPTLRAQVADLEDRIRVILGSRTWKMGRLVVAPIGRIKRKILGEGKRR